MTARTISPFSSYLYFVSLERVGCRARIYTVDVTKVDLLAALDSPIKDFEDALVSTCVIKASLDFIVTRDTEFLKNEKTIAPNEFLERFLRP